MTSGADKGKAEKRANRAVGLAEAIGGTLGAVLKKRGFASRELVTHWSVIAPAPYCDVASPDELKWPRGDRGTDGAVLLVRCADSHRLALQHEGQALASAINRYFGYLLVGEVRLSAAPFSPGSAPKAKGVSRPDAAVAAKVEARLAGIDDPALKEALRLLGQGLMSTRK